MRPRVKHPLRFHGRPPEYPLAAEVGRALREARHARGWRQADVATEIGISQPLYSRIECGRVPISVAQLWTIAHVLGTRASEVQRRAEQLDRRGDRDG